MASFPSRISFVSSAVCSWTLGSNANAHTSSRSHWLPFTASSAARAMSASLRVPNSGPTHIRTAAPASVSPSAWMYVPGNVSSRANVIRCFLSVPFTPARRRLSRIIVRNDEL